MGTGPDENRLTVPRSARLVRIPLEGGVSATDACLLVRDDRRPFALTGGWAGGGALVGSEPLVAAGEHEDPFELLDFQPEVSDAEQGAVGGGWFGWLGYGLGARLERIPPAPPRPAPLPQFALAFYDHLLHLDSAGQWWFEALWTDARAAALGRRAELLGARLAEGVGTGPVWVGELEPVAPGAAGHLAAVEECRERIAAGEIFQANVCLRLEGRWAGDPLDLFARAAGALEPRHAGVVAGPWGAVCSLSPELFLRREGRRVVTEPIKGTAPRQSGARHALLASAKDRAENVMIADLMRNDLGRVCEYGSIEVPELVEPRPGPGVWHLVSTVAGRLRPEIGNADLLRASFPPGSVTGAPKIQAMRVIAELEASGREAYTGAVGYASPLAGLELNVAIRTLELRGERVWLGVGGGIVADSDPARELEECLVKARPVVAAAGGRVVVASAPRAAAAGPPRALDGVADRPDPALGVFSTLLVRDAAAVDLEAHLARLRGSVETLYGQTLPGDLERRVEEAVAGRAGGRLRLLVAPANGDVAAVEVACEQWAAADDPESLTLVAFALPGGLGAHKWRDRRLLAELERRGGGVPLFVDLDGEVLEAGHANVWIVEDATLVTPPLDGRLLAGAVRQRLPAAAAEAGLEAREEPLTLARVAAADEVLLTSSLRGVHPARCAGAGGRFVAGARLQAALLGEPAALIR